MDRRLADFSRGLGAPGHRGSPALLHRKAGETAIGRSCGKVTFFRAGGLTRGKRGSYGRGWDIALGLAGSIVVSWLFQRQWAPDPSLVAVIFVAAVGAAGLIVAQRTVFPSHA